MVRVFDGIQKPSISKKFHGHWNISVRTDYPPNAIAVNNPSSPGTLQKLKMDAKESGYKLRENRAFMSSVKSDTYVWYRAMEFSEKDNIEPFIKIWQKRKDGCCRIHFLWNVR